MEDNAIIVLATTFGAGSVLTIFAKALVDWWQGKQGKEQNAWVERDKYARRWRMVEETLHTMRQWCHKTHDAAYEDMPPWPDYPDPK